MYYKKAYNFGHLGLKGNSNNANKILGHSKNTNEIVGRVVNALAQETEKKIHNYLEKK